TTMLLVPPHKRVYPSAGLRATDVEPTTPPAPGSLRITIGCPNSRYMASPNSLAVISVGPPGGKGTTNVTGLSGYAALAACAAADIPQYAVDTWNNAGLNKAR